MLISIFGALYDGLPLIPLAVALIWTLRYQKIPDLSLAGSFSFSAAITAATMNSGGGAVTSIGLGILIGLSVGLLMGFTVNILLVDSLLSGVVILFIAYALSLGITQGTIAIPPEANPLEPILVIDSNIRISAWMHPAMNFVFFIIAAITIAITTLIFRTEWGCAFRALEDLKGGRPLLHSLGVNPSKLSFLGFILAAILASISGILVTLRDGQTTSSLGLMSLIEIIPAYLLGISLFERKPTLKDLIKPNMNFLGIGNMFILISSGIRFLKKAPPALAAALGVVLFFVIINLAQRWAGVPWLPRVLIGVTLLVVLGTLPAIDAWKRKRRQKRSTHIKDHNIPLEIKDLTVSYPAVTGPNIVLRNLYLQACSSDIVLLKGANGCGKTTLLRALADQVDCTGEFIIPLRNTEQKKPERSHMICYIPQDATENTAATLSIEEHVNLALCGSKPSLLRPWKKSNVDSIIELGLSDLNIEPSSVLQWLSGGQIRRVLLGLIKARKEMPVVIAMDEPFSHLDDAGREHCSNVISSLADEGNIILLVDHQNNITPTRTIDDQWLNGER